jgi:hypothetical protein
MNRPEKKHHHFVPQVYLRKFHHTKESAQNKNKFFVSAFDKSTDESHQKINIAEICAKKKLYTIDSPNIDEREYVENLYADTFEKDYNTFYELITDSTKEIITNIERELIIGTVAHLHLRNYFWYKTLNGFFEKIIDRFDDNFKEKVYDENGYVLFDFSNYNKDQIRADSQRSNKQVFIKSQLKQTVDWTKYHFHDVIVVERISNDHQRYITGDRPVISTGLDSSLRLTLDSKHMLSLIPTRPDFESVDSQIFRGQAIIPPDMINIMCYENSERMVIGHDIKDIQDAKNKYENAKATIC